MKYVISGILIFYAASSRALTLSDAVTQTWRQSALISAQSDLADLAAGDRWRRFVPNAPQFQFTSADDETQHSFGLTETVPLPFKVIAATRVDAARDRSQRAELGAKRYEIARTTIQAYVDCATAQTVVGLQQQSIDDNETLSRTMRARYESGGATQAETIGVTLQTRGLRADLAAAEDRVVTSCGRLEKLLGARLPTEPLALDSDLAEELLGVLGPLTPDELRAEAAADVAVANGAMAWWSQLPDLSLTLTKNHYLYLPGSPSGKPDTWTYGIALTLPIFLPFKETVEASRARGQAAVDRGTAELQRLTARADKREAAREYARSRRRLQEIRQTDLALAEALLESTLSAYRQGKLGFAELTMARKTLADLRAQDLLLRGAIIVAHLRCLRECDGGQG